MTSASGPSRENTLIPSSLRNTQDMTATLCSCGGRKSLPVFVRRIWNATSATSASGRSAGSPCRRRMPATSGTVSMSKARTEFIKRSRTSRFLVGKHARRKIAVAAVADDGDDHGVLEVPGDAQGNGRRAAGGDAGEDTLLARQAPRRLFGVGLIDVLDAVDARLVVDFRQVGFGPLADARDLRALLGLAADDLDFRVLLLEKARAAHDGAGSAHGGDEMRDPAAGIAPYLGRRALVVRPRVVGIGELVEHDSLLFPHHLFGQVARRL